MHIYVYVYINIFLKKRKVLRICMFRTNLKVAATPATSVRTRGMSGSCLQMVLINLASVPMLLKYRLLMPVI